MNQLELELRKIVAEIAETDDDTKITQATHLHRDLGINSMHGLELILLVEDLLKIRVPPEALSEIETFGDVVRFARNGQGAPSA
jgi:acyl carrier protein